MFLKSSRRARFNRAGEEATSLFGRRTARRSSSGLGWPPGPPPYWVDERLCRATTRMSTTSSRRRRRQCCCWCCYECCFEAAGSFYFTVVKQRYQNHFWKVPISRKNDWNSRPCTPPVTFKKGGRQQVFHSMFTGVSGLGILYLMGWEK